MEPRGYRDLDVWQRSRSLAVEIFQVTGQPCLRTEWTFKDQIRRAALSVPCNIAEGWARGYERDSARFFLIARGPLAEISTQADIGGAIGILDLGKSEAWQSECHRLGGRLTRLIDARHRRMSRRT